MKSVTRTSVANKKFMQCPNFTSAMFKITTHFDSKADSLTRVMGRKHLKNLNLKRKSFSFSFLLLVILVDLFRVEDCFGEMLLPQVISLAGDGAFQINIAIH